MLQINLVIRKILWGALACLSMYFVNHFYAYGKQYASQTDFDLFLLFFIESWLFAWIIVLFLSIIMMLREK